MHTIARDPSRGKTRPVSAPTPWEEDDRPFVDRTWATIWGATSDPVGTFTRIGAADGDRDLSAGVRFALLATAIGWAPFVVFTPCLALVPFFAGSALPERIRVLGTGLLCGIVGASPFVVLLSSVAVELVHAAIFHALARLLGGVGDFRRSLHAMLYTSAVRVWLLPAFFLGFVPVISGMVHVGVRMGFVLWAGFACYGAARGAHGLDDQRSVVVGILTPLLAVAIVSFCMAAVGVAILVTVVGTTVGLHDLERFFT